MRRFLLAGAMLAVLTAVLPVLAAEDTPKAAATRKKLKQKVTLDLKDAFVSEIIDEIKEQVKDIIIQVDTKGGVSRNRRMTIKCKDKPLEEALDEMLKKETLGYIVISNTKNAYDGGILIRMGTERGYPAEEKDKGKEKEKSK